MKIVSIIIPCYNQAQYLDECLQSVLEQTFQQWECIIVNDGSPDNTEEVAQNWCKKDQRFKYLFKENGGLSSARNFGISAATTQYILPLDADDKIANQYIELALNAFQQDKDLKVVYCKAERFGDVTGEWHLPPFSLKAMAVENMIFCTAMFNKNDWELVGGYDLKMIYGWEDWEFWIANLKNGGKVKQLDYIGFYYRIKKNSMVKALDYQKRESLLQYMSIKHPDFYVAQLGSYKKLNDDLENVKEEFNNKLKSEKFVIDLFCKTFLGFTIFGKYKTKK